MRLGCHEQRIVRQPRFTLHECGKRFLPAVPLPVTRIGAPQHRVTVSIQFAEVRPVCVRAEIQRAIVVFFQQSLIPE